MTQFNIEIVSDVICPWCYIGKKKLDKAIAEYKQRYPNSDDTFSTIWKPFYLNPDASKTGVDKTALYRLRFGEARAKQIFARVAQAGVDVGINFKLGGRTGDTRNSHRLVQLGKSKGAATQTRVVEALMEAYFENEQDITSTEVLKAAGVKAGLDENEVAEWLAGDAGGREVDMEVRAAKMAGISGVPNFMVNGHYEIGGAQDPDVFLGLFEKIKAAETQ